MGGGEEQPHQIKKFGFSPNLKHLVTLEELSDRTHPNKQISIQSLKIFSKETESSDYLIKQMVANPLSSFDKEDCAHI